MRNILVRPVEGADIIAGANSAIAQSGVGERLSYAILVSIISLLWAPPWISFGFLALCCVWEFGLRPPVIKAILRIEDPKSLRLAYYAAIFFAALIYGTIQVYGLVVQHPIGWMVQMMTFCISVMCSVAYLSRDKIMFAMTVGPATLSAFSAPFLMGADFTTIMAMTALNGVLLSAAIYAMRHHDEMFASFYEESRARTQAEQSSFVKTQFLSTMSHELRTPLNAIIGYSEMMKETAQDEGRAGDTDDHDKVIRAANSLLMLINDILDISKIEAGKMQLNIEPFDVSQMVRDACATAQPLMQRNSNRFDISMAHDLGLAETDGFRLNQCLLNLLSNAAKFTKNGTVRLSVSREHVKSGDQLVFDVSDSGIGMSEEQVAQLFQPFVQADSKITRTYGGTGLGLAITQRIAAMLGGDVKVTSKQGAGSTFTIRIPARLQARETVQLNQHQAPITPGLPIALVIDDDEHARELVSRNVTRAGMAALCAVSAEEGLELARQHELAIIILDINMPGRSGWSALEELRTDERFIEVPILMLSIEEDRERALALGACELLTKPVGKAKLVSTILRYARMPAATAQQATEKALRAAG